MKPNLLIRSDYVETCARFRQIVSLQIQTKGSGIRQNTQDIWN